jgi:hypothetical protein
MKQKNVSHSNSRRWPRLKPADVPLLKSVTYSQGSDVRIVNISRGGILLETDGRLRPQMKIVLKLITSEGAIKIEGRILRSSVSSLKGIPRYQSAIAFDHPFNMLDDLSLQAGESAHETRWQSTESVISDSDSDGPLVQSTPDGDSDQNPAVLTVITQDGTSLQEMFDLNDW